MTDPTTTRRHVLGVTAASLGSTVAGCGSSIRSEDDDQPDVDPPGETTDFEAFELRTDESPQFVFLYDEAEEQYRERGQFLLTEADVPDLRIVSVDDADAAAARSFVAATDFERESIVLEQHPVTEDGERLIRSLTVARDRLEMEYCQPTARVRHWSQALFLRVPYPYSTLPRISRSGRAPCGNLGGVAPEQP